MEQGRGILREQLLGAEIKLQKRSGRTRKELFETRRLKRFARQGLLSRASRLGRIQFGKISHGVYPEYAEWVRDNSRHFGLSFRANARNLSPSFNTHEVKLQHLPRLAQPAE